MQNRTNEEVFYAWYARTTQPGLNFSTPSIVCFVIGELYDSDQQG